jgi:hypothetical protein
MPHPQPSVRRAIAVVAILLLPARAPARQISVPILLDHQFLRQMFLTQMYTGDGHTARVWDDDQDCNFLILSDPQIDTYSGLLRIRSAAQARVGTAIGGGCVSVIDWSGTVETLHEPTLEAGAAVVRFRVFDSNLYGAQNKKAVTGTLWDWVKAYVHPRLEAVTVDLESAFGELRDILPLVLPTDDAASTRQMLDSLSLAYLRANADGLAFTLHFDVAERTLPIESATPEPTLSADELQRWEVAWQQWDAFLTFVAKHAARDAPVDELRAALFDVLIEGRRDVLAALAPSESNAPDPVPALFVKTWKRLAPVLRRLHVGLPGETALQYLSFIAAGDALVTFDEIGPSIGFDISADGLRRLARIIAPATAEDPVAYSTDVDPTLRELFGFGPPLPPPTETTPPDTSWFLWLVAPAWAAVVPEAETTARLNRWVPTRDEIPEYLPLVRMLLLRTSALTLESKTIDPRFHDLYRWMLLATAWQESCWRQFIRDGDRVKPILSPAGAVGLMQVSQKVWRGFYDLDGLRNDIAYNARAGSEILMHYLRDYAIAKGEHSKRGGIDNLPRATYAVYNGGPGHLSRYRKPATRKALRKIDQSFWNKYQRVKSGGEMAVVECFGHY